MAWHTPPLTSTRLLGHIPIPISLSAASIYVSGAPLTAAPATRPLLVAEVIESAAHLDDVLAALDADDHLLVRLDAALETLRQRIIVREPPGWVGLDHLLAETPELQAALAELEGVHAVVDTDNSTFTQIVDQIRSARPDMLS